MTERLQLLQGSVLDREASMGPSSGDDGEAAGDFKLYVQEKASMGPSSGDDGERMVKTLEDLAKSASMGPSSGDDGERCVHCHVPLLSVLQWGRHQVMTERWQRRHNIE